MSGDTEIAVKGFWYPEEVAAAAGVAGLECTTCEGLVIVHPRPRPLTEEELRVLRERLAEVKPAAAEREAEREKVASAEGRARQAKFAAFKAKATAGKATSADLTDVVLALIGE